MSIVSALQLFARGAGECFGLLGHAAVTVFCGRESDPDGCNGDEINSPYTGDWLNPKVPERRKAPPPPPPPRRIGSQPPMKNDFNEMVNDVCRKTNSTGLKINI